MTKPCCKHTAEEIMAEARNPEYIARNKRMIAKYGKILSLVEMKELSVKQGITLAEFIERV